MASEAHPSVPREDVFDGASETPDGTRPRPQILLADDNADLREDIRRLLVQQGYEVIAVAEGKAALAAARQHKPDLVLTDVMMPRLDGFGLLRELRRDPATRTLPIIFLTARDGEEACVEGVSQGADDYITKPFNAPELLARVATHLKLVCMRREAEQRVTGLLENLADGFQVVDATGRFSYMNLAARRMLAEQGINADDLMGKHVIDEAFPERRDDEFGQAFRKALTERIAASLESFHKPWQRWYAIRIHPIPDGGVSIYFQDITERKRAGAASAFLAAIVQHSEDAIISKNLNGGITSWNRGAERLFGYTAEEAVGKAVTMLIPPDRLNEEPKILERLRRGEVVDHFETIRVRKDGSTVNISLTISPIRDDQGRIVGASKIARDITDVVQARQTMQERRAELEQLVEKRTAELRETAMQLETFSYSIVHDMRAPLRSMRSFAAFLRDEYGDKVDDEGRKYLTRIIDSAARMDALITDVLSYSRISAGETPMSRVNLDKLVSEIIEQYPHFHEHAGKIHVEHPLPSVQGNPALLTQIISNLLGNALKFVALDREPRVVIRSEERAADSHASPPAANHNGVVRLWVEDNGIGIDAQYRDKIFGLFQRLHRPDQYAGTGVGLAVVKKAAEKMGGTAGFESEPGKGSRFWVDLPKDSGIPK